MIKNYAELFVLEAYNIIIQSDEGYCTCEKCKNDALAIALNNLPCMYATCETGAMYQKMRELDPQFRVTILGALTKAMQIVKRNPRH